MPANSRGSFAPPDAIAAVIQVLWELRADCLRGFAGHPRRLTLVVASDENWLRRTSNLNGIHSIFRSF